jgi:hypothetical protein
MAPPSPLRFALDDFAGWKIDWSLTPGLSLLLGPPDSRASALVGQVSARFSSRANPRDLGPAEKARFLALCQRVLPGMPDPMDLVHRTHGPDASEVIYLLRSVLTTTLDAAMAAPLSNLHPVPLRRLVRVLHEEALARGIPVLSASPSPVVLDAVGQLTGLERVFVLDAEGLAQGQPRPVPFLTVPGHEDLDPLDVPSLFLRGELLARPGRPAQAPQAGASAAGPAGPSQSRTAG